MKWFKHDTDGDLSEGLSFLLSQEGFSGYGRWFRLLEIVAYKMDGSDNCGVEYPSSKWCSLLGLKQKKLISFLELTENKLKTKVFSFDNIIRIEIPNLLKKRDEYSRKSGQNPDNIAQEIRVKNKDTDKDNIKAQKPTPPPEKENEFLLSELKDLTEKLYQQKIFPQVYAFLNKALKEKKNIKAILYTLKQCLLNKPKEPWGYCVQILKIENGNFNEHDHTQKGKETNNMFLDLVEKLKLISGKQEEIIG
jgi:hypothetical protein